MITTATTIDAASTSSQRPGLVGGADTEFAAPSSSAGPVVVAAMAGLAAPIAIVSDVVTPQVAEAASYTDISVCFTNSYTLYYQMHTGPLGGVPTQVQYHNGTNWVTWGIVSTDRNGCVSERVPDGWSWRFLVKHNIGGSPPYCCAKWFVGATAADYAGPYYTWNFGTVSVAGPLPRLPVGW